MDRLVFLPVTLVTVLIAAYFNLTYAGFGIFVGIVLPVFSLVRGEDIFSSTTAGYLCGFLGIAFLVIAYLICNHYGISFAELDNDRSFPRLVRRLPYYGIALLSTAATTMAISIIKQHHA